MNIYFKGQQNKKACIISRSIGLNYRN